METLRFAPVIRVSTEKQERRGESLRVQTEQIGQYVDLLHGQIPAPLRKKYAGQEHATPDYERRKLDELLADAARGLYDAVIVADASRWSRDNRKSKEGLQTLRDHGIRFFVGTSEYDLFNPEHSFILGMTAEVGELQARQQALKSINSRIQRAQAGRPSVGKRPYGRVYDDKTGTWQLDPVKAEIIRTAATRYLSGEGINDIAASIGMNAANLHRTLTQKAGPVWTVRFRNSKVNVDTTVDIKVPELLDTDTRTAILTRMDMNKTFHGTPKRQYLLSKMVFCAQCGYHLHAYANHQGKRYYRHSYAKHDRDCPHRPLHIPAAELETAVLLHLKNTLGDPARVRRAVERATPNAGRIEALEAEKDRLDHKLTRLDNERQKIVQAIGKGLITDEDVRKGMEKVRNGEAACQERITTIETMLEQLPDLATVGHFSKLGRKVLAHATKNPRNLERWTYERKRELVEAAFIGKDAEGKPLGVWLHFTDNPEHPYNVEMRGALENTMLSLPLSDEYLIKAFNLDPEYCDVQEELVKLKNKYIRR